MAVEQLVRAIGEGHNPRGARDRFFGDPRLMRINRSQWALRSWDLEEYTGITDEIAQRIEAGGGRADLQTLVDEITRQFDVRAGSVKVYAEAPMFVVDGGSVRLRRDDEPFPISGHVSGCRGAFVSSIDQVSVVLPVDKDTTRGSGRGCAPAVADLLGVSPGRPRTWRWAEGELVVTWPRTAAFGPSIGSTRALARSVDAVEGDSIRLDFDLAVGEVRCQRIPAVVDPIPAHEAIELITGVDLDGVDPLAAIAPPCAYRIRTCGDDLWSAAIRSWRLCCRARRLTLHSKPRCVTSRTSSTNGGDVVLVRAQVVRRLRLSVGENAPEVGHQWLHWSRVARHCFDQELTTGRRIARDLDHLRRPVENRLAFLGDG